MRTQTFTRHWVVALALANFGLVTSANAEQELTQTLSQDPAPIVNKSDIFAEPVIGEDDSDGIAAAAPGLRLDEVSSLFGDGAPQRLATARTMPGRVSGGPAPITTASETCSAGCDGGCDGGCGGSCDSGFGGSCDSGFGGGCDGGCGSGGGFTTMGTSLCTTCPGTCCCCPPKRIGVFADALYLRLGNADLTYAVEQTGCDPLLSSPTGQVGRVAPDFELGYRIGFEAATCNGGVIRATYSMLENNTEDRIFATGTNVLHSQVTHPSAGDCALNSQLAFARYDIDFDLVDIDYRYRCLHCGCGGIDFVAGVRYARLQQEFFSQQIIALPSGQTNVETDIDFDGLGVRLGFDGNWSNGKKLHFYGRGTGNFVGGEFKADYTQTSQFGGTAIIASSIEDYRVMAILDAEAGVGFSCRGGKLRLMAGYQVSGWFDTLTTSQFIAGVQQQSFDDLGDVLTFSGLVLRAETRF